MSVTTVLQFVRDSMLSQKTLEGRRKTLSTIKTAQVASSAIMLGSFGLAILNAYDHNPLCTLGFLALSYAGLECKTVADNVHGILENPAQEIRAIYNKLHSDEEYWRFITQGAPLLQKAGLHYINTK